jgi:putative phage-type endonuclease
MKIHNCLQGTDLWHQIRLSKITASKFAILMGKTFGKTVYTYAYEIVAEMLTGEWKEVSAKQMDWGHQNEPKARKNYKLATFNHVEEIGFIEHSEMIGCSPDGLIGKSGMLEIKCPWNSSNHVISLSKKEVPAIYKAQVQGQLWVSERDWCDFVSYDPRIKDPLKQLIIIRANRDESYIDELKNKVYKFRDVVLGVLDNLGINKQC